MLLLEHDGKELLAEHGIPVAAGVLVSSAPGLDASMLPPGLWVVKVQVPTVAVERPVASAWLTLSPRSRCSSRRCSAAH